VRVSWSTTTVAAVLTVLTCTLVPLPFHVDRPAVTSIYQFFLIGFGPDRSPDILENLVLFLPLGFMLTGYFTQQGLAPSSAFATVLLLSACGSYGIEVLQQFIPGRFPSLSDIVANTVGGVVGFLCYRFWYLFNKDW